MRKRRDAHRGRRWQEGEWHHTITRMGMITIMGTAIILTITTTMIITMTTSTAMTTANPAS